MPSIRAVRRAITIVLWTFFAVVVQAISNQLPGRGKVLTARLFWRVFSTLLGLRVRVIGSAASHPGTRPVVFEKNVAQSSFAGLVAALLSLSLAWLTLTMPSVTEAVNPSDEDFGEQRLADLVASLRDRPAREIVKAVHAEVARFTQGAPPADDITVVVARRL